MDLTHHLAEIREANFTYLQLAQSLIRYDLAQAVVQLGIPRQVAELIRDLPQVQLIKISTQSQLICRMRFEDENLWSLLCNHLRPPKSEPVSRLHAQILAARS